MTRKRYLIALAIGVLTGFGMLVSCGKHSDKTEMNHVEKVKSIDSLVRARMDVSPEETLTYIDSLETADLISYPVGCYWRALVYNTLQQKTTSVLFFQKALEGDALRQECPELFYKASDYLSTFLSNRGENAEALEVASRSYEMAQQDKSPLGRRWTAIALHSMGYFQTQLGMKEDAERSFSMAYMALSQIVQADSSYQNILSYARVSLNILDAYTTTGQFGEAMKWISSAEVAAERLAASPECVESDRAKFVGGIALQKALVMAKMGSMAQADEAYKEAQKVGYFNTAYGLFEQGHYLRTAERWDELVALMPKADSVAQAWKVPMSLYYVQEYVAPRFTACLKSGRKEQALEVAEKLVNAMDSVAIHEQQHEMQEIAVIAKRKDMHTAAALQEAAAAYRWVKILSTVLILLIVGIIGFAVYQSIRSLKK